MVKVKLLEAIAPHEKNDEIEMREDLAKGLFKDKVEILKGQKKESGDQGQGSLESGEKPLNKMNKTELQAKATDLGVNFVEEDTKKQLLEAIESKIAENDAE